MGDLRRLLSTTLSPDKEREKLFIRDPEIAADYAIHVLRGPWPEAHGVISQCPYSSYRYARLAVRGRVPELEESIKRNPYTAYLYLKNVIGDDLPEFNNAIDKDVEVYKLYNHWRQMLDK